MAGKRFFKQLIVQLQLFGGSQTAVSSPAINSPRKGERGPSNIKPRLELDTLQPEILRELWSKLLIQYFPDRTDLIDYSIRWVDRSQRRTLASCSVTKRRVHVAAALNCSRCEPILEPLIYHEMCHAVLGKPLEVGGRRVWHGREFKALERRHPGIPELDAWIRAGHWMSAVRTHKSRKTRQAKRSY